jgi:hypothetical protein
VGRGDPPMTPDQSLKAMGKSHGFFVGRRAFQRSLYIAAINNKRMNKMNKGRRSYGTDESLIE